MSLRLKLAFASKESRDGRLTTAAPAQDRPVSALIPTHLAGHVIPLETEHGRRFVLRSSAGGTLFETRYSGELLPEHGLIVGAAAPSLVVARALDTGEEVVVFDGGRHGYDAMFAEEHDPESLAARRPDTVLERDGHSAFAVEVTVMDNIDWDDEADDFRDEAGVLRLITGEEISAERLRADGYDALGVTVIWPDDRRGDVVDEELT